MVHMNRRSIHLSPSTFLSFICYILLLIVGIQSIFSQTRLWVRLCANDYVWLEFHAWWTKSLVNNDKTCILVLLPMLYMELVIWPLGEVDGPWLVMPIGNTRELPTIIDLVPGLKKWGRNLTMVTKNYASWVCFLWCVLTFVMILFCNNCLYLSIKYLAIQSLFDHENFTVFGIPFMRYALCSLTSCK